MVPLRYVILGMLLLSLPAMAFTVKPAYIGIKDTGGQSLESLDVGITIDCDTKDLTIDVLGNSTRQAVSGADITLFDTTYGYQALPNRVKTGSDGEAVMTVPGTLNFLTHMFILRVDAQNYRSREIEFYYQKCFEAPPVTPPPTPPVPPAQNATNQPNTNLSQNNTNQPPPPPQNTSQPGNQNQSMPGNQSGTANGSNNTGPIVPPSPSPSSGCPIPALGFVSLVLISLIRRR